MYISPTSIELFLACKRKWSFRYIDKIKTPVTENMQFGIDGHSRIEKFFKKKIKNFGSDKIGELVNKAYKKGLLPQKIENLQVEKKFSIRLSNNVNLIGYIDILAEKTNLNPLMVIDHKFIKDFKWALTEEKLASNIQAIIYSFAALTQYPQKEILNRWIYYNKNKKTVKKIEILRSVDEVCDAINILKSLCEKIAIFKKECPAAIQTEPNFLSCSAYGGCPHIEKCNPKPEEKLVSLFEQNNFLEKGSRKMSDVQNKLNALLQKVKNEKNETEESKPEESNPEKPKRRRGRPRKTPQLESKTTEEKKTKNTKEKKEYRTALKNETKESVETTLDMAMKSFLEQYPSKGDALEVYINHSYVSSNGAIPFEKMVTPLMRLLNYSGNAIDKEYMLFNYLDKWLTKTQYKGIITINWHSSNLVRTALVTLINHSDFVLSR